MQKILKFYKMHALMNDFTLFCKSDTEGMDIAKFVRHVSNRKTGIGCDQVVLYSAEQDTQKVSVEFYNPDGSCAEICGNALRGIALLLRKLRGYKEVLISTVKRTIYAEIITESENITQGVVRVIMGPPIFSSELTSKMRFINDIVKNGGVFQYFDYVDIGNPHVVLICTQKKKSYVSDNIVKSLGQEIDKSFKNGMNVGFAVVHNGEIYLKVWERGAGLTESCGSGACAAVSIVNKLSIINKPEVVVHQIGGDLYISMDKELSLSMVGTAEFCFTGEISA